MPLRKISDEQSETDEVRGYLTRIDTTLTAKEVMQNQHIALLFYLLCDTSLLSQPPTLRYQIISISGKLCVTSSSLCSKA